MHTKTHVGGLKIKEKPEKLPEKSREEVRKMARQLVDKLGLNKGQIVTGKYAELHGVFNKLWEEVGKK